MNFSSFLLHLIGTSIARCYYKRKKEVGKCSIKSAKNSKFWQFIVISTRRITGASDFYTILLYCLDIYAKRNRIGLMVKQIKLNHILAKTFFFCEWKKCTWLAHGQIDDEKGKTFPAFYGEICPAHKIDKLLITNNIGSHINFDLIEMCRIEKYRLTHWMAIRRR